MEHPPRLFLGNILWNTTQNQIQQVLDKYKVGQGVQHIHIPRKGNVIDGKQHTIAFVTYEEKEQVEEAISLLHDRILEGVSTYPVSAMHARSRHEGKQYPQFPKTASQSGPGTQDRGNQTVPVRQEVAHEGVPHQRQEQKPFVLPRAFQQGLGQSHAFKQTWQTLQPSQPCQHGFQQPGPSLFGGPFQSGGHSCAPAHSAQPMHHGAAFEPMMAFGQHVPGHFGSHQVHHGTMPPWRNPPGATCKAKSVVPPKPKPTSRVPSVDENKQAFEENQWYRAQDQAKPDTTSCFGSWLSWSIQQCGSYILLLISIRPLAFSTKSSRHSFRLRLRLSLGFCFWLFFGHLLSPLLIHEAPTTFSLGVDFICNFFEVLLLLQWHFRQDEFVQRISNGQ